MKELSIEEKAKAYDKALERAKAMIKVAANQDEAIGFANTIFPELKESEDERIRKSLIDMLKNDEKCYLKEIAWLEKQGSQKLANSAKTCKDEQKPTDKEMKELLHTEYEKGRADAIAEMQNLAWSEEDMSKVQRICKYLDEAKKYYADITEVRECTNWLKSLKDRVQPRRRHTIFDEII